ncbi:chemotaxis protein, partial [Candidatus Aerophobetes bacterium]|nr:chemotaxis protein [Candidatus Aerophobetes bacterium]
MYLSREDFQSIRDLINRKTGLFFDEKKTYFVTNRLSRRMEEIGCD